MATSWMPWGRSGSAISKWARLRQGRSLEIGNHVCCGFLAQLLWSIEWDSTARAFPMLFDSCGTVPFGEFEASASERTRTLRSKGLRMTISSAFGVRMPWRTILQSMSHRRILQGSGSFRPQEGWGRSWFLCRRSEFVWLKSMEKSLRSLSKFLLISMRNSWYPLPRNSNGSALMVRLRRIRRLFRAIWTESRQYSRGVASAVGHCTAGHWL